MSDFKKDVAPPDRHVTIDLDAYEQHLPPEIEVELLRSLGYRAFIVDGKVAIILKGHHDQT